MEYYSNKISEKNIIKLIHKLLLQPAILDELLLLEPKNVRKNAFTPENKLSKENKNYGDPMYSLHSYLQFFEDPLVHDNAESQIPDWLVYKNIDIYSTPMDVNDDIVLTEFRGFGRMLTTYIYANGNAEIKKLMTEGICNLRAKKSTPDIRVASIETLRTFIKLRYPNLESSSKPSLVAGSMRRSNIRSHRVTAKSYPKGNKYSVNITRNRRSLPKSKRPVTKTKYKK
jgi:hypothetical protein